MLLFVRRILRGDLLAMGELVAAWSGRGAPLRLRPRVWTVQKRGVANQVARSTLQVRYKYTTCILQVCMAWFVCHVSRVVPYATWRLLQHVHTRARAVNSEGSNLSVIERRRGRESVDVCEHEHIRDHPLYVLMRVSFPLSVLHLSIVVCKPAHPRCNLCAST